MDSPRYRNYGELIDPSRNMQKFWLVECDHQEVWVRYGRITPGMGASPGERFWHLLAKPQVAQSKRVGQVLQHNALEIGLDRALNKEREGYTFLWNVYTGQPSLDVSPTERDALPVMDADPPATPPAAPSWTTQARRWF